MGVGFAFYTVFFIARPSQCPRGRRGPGQFVEDDSPVADPFGRVRAVPPALQMVLKKTFIAEPASGNDPRGRTAALGLLARPGLLPDASRTLAGRPNSDPCRQVSQPSATVDAGRATDRLIHRSVAALGGQLTGSTVTALRDASKQS